MASKPSTRSRINPKQSSTTNESAKPGCFTRVGSSLRMVDGVKRKVPTIVVSGEWLETLGFPIGEYIYLSTLANRRMAIWRPGLKRPRFLYIMTPEALPRRNKRATG